MQGQSTHLRQLNKILISHDVHDDNPSCNAAVLRLSHAARRGGQRRRQQEPSFVQPAQRQSSPTHCPILHTWLRATAAMAKGPALASLLPQEGSRKAPLLLGLLEAMALMCV